MCAAESQGSGEESQANSRDGRPSGSSSGSLDALRTDVKYIPQGCYGVVRKEDAREVEGLCTGDMSVCIPLIVKTTEGTMLFHVDPQTDLLDPDNGLAAIINREFPDTTAAEIMFRGGTDVDHCESRRKELGRIAESMDCSLSEIPSNGEGYSEQVYIESLTQKVYFQDSNFVGNVRYIDGSERKGELMPVEIDSVKKDLTALALGGARFLCNNSSMANENERSLTVPQCSFRSQNCTGGDVDSIGTSTQEAATLLGAMQATFSQARLPDFSSRDKEGFCEEVCKNLSKMCNANKAVEGLREVDPVELATTPEGKVTQEVFEQMFLRGGSRETRARNWKLAKQETNFQFFMAPPSEQGRQCRAAGLVQAMIETSQAGQSLSFVHDPTLLSPHQAVAAAVDGHAASHGGGKDPAEIHVEFDRDLPGRSSSDTPAFSPANKPAAEQVAAGPTTQTPSSHLAASPPHPQDCAHLDDFLEKAEVENVVPGQSEQAQTLHRRIPKKGWCKDNCTAL